MLFLLILVFVPGCCRSLCHHFGWIFLGIVVVRSRIKELYFRLRVWNRAVRTGMQGDLHSVCHMK